jgi:hypothetical protein
MDDTARNDTARRLRAQKAFSTDPAYLERMARDLVSDRTRIPVVVNGMPYKSVRAAWRALQIGSDSERRTFRKQLRKKSSISFEAADGRRYDFEVI